MWWINQPEVWSFKQGCRADFAGKKVPQEPFIQAYQKFNSNTGWADESTPWPRVRRAVSHFSYHVSNGKSLLCDLQGGVYQDRVVLTDPVVMSVSRSYGPTDLRSEGINSFFANHTCNEFWRSNWRTLWNPIRYHSSRKDTTMEYVPTRRSRPQIVHGGCPWISSNYVWVGC